MIAGRCGTSLSIWRGSFSLLLDAIMILAAYQLALKVIKSEFTVASLVKKIQIRRISLSSIAIIEKKGE
jgi:hypothetical protein